MANQLVRRPSAALLGAVADRQAGRLLGALGDAFSCATSAVELATAIARILADQLELGFIELRAPSSNHGVDLVLARLGTPSATLMDIELTLHGAPVATLTVPAGTSRLDGLRGWLSLALGSLLDLEAARGGTLKSEQHREEAAQALNAVIQLHSDAVYLLQGHTTTALNAAAQRAHRDPSLPSALGPAAAQHTSELLPVPSGALLFRGPAEPSPVDRARDFAQRWKLTKRQQATLEALVEGKANKEIATALDVSVVTVEGHLTAVFRRTGVSTRSALVAAVLLGESSPDGE